VKLAEPPSCDTSLVLIGRNRNGQWVAQEQNGLYGGLFTHRADAVRYALFENGGRSDAVISIGCTLELDMAARPSTAAMVQAITPAARPRAA
jgi:hypothetical protein